MTQYAFHSLSFEKGETKTAMNIIKRYLPYDFDSGAVCNGEGGLKSIFRHDGPTIRTLVDALTKNKRVGPFQITVYWDDADDVRQSCFMHSVHGIDISKHHHFTKLIKP